MSPQFYSPPCLSALSARNAAKYPRPTTYANLQMRLLLDDEIPVDNNFLEQCRNQMAPKIKIWFGAF